MFAHVEQVACPLCGADPDAQHLDEICDGDVAAATLAVDAVNHRFRPVLLSSATSFVGMLPIIFETGPQAQTLVPLVVAVAFGLLASFVLVVFVFPSALAIFFDYKNVEGWLKTRSYSNG